VIGSKTVSTDSSARAQVWPRRYWLGPARQANSCFEFALWRVDGVCLGVEAAVRERTVQALVEEQEQQRDGPEYPCWR